jgi:hypothetical protein
MLRRHHTASLTLMIIAVLALPAGVMLDWGLPSGAGNLPGGACGKGPYGVVEALRLLNHIWTIAIALIGLLLAAIVQTLVNRMVPPVGTAPG